MKKACVLSLILFVTLFVDYCYSQTPIPQIGFPNKSIVSPYSQTSNHGFSQQEQNAQLIREVHEHQRQLKETKKAEEQNNRQKEMQLQYDIMMLTQYGFPMQSEYEGTSAFYSAFEEINNMLVGTDSLNLGRAIFLVENAWYNNQYNYDDYKKAIESQVKLCNQIIEEEKLDKNDNLVKNMMIFRIITDTLNIKDKATKKTQTHYPVKYNYEDYESKINYSSQFVTTLMNTNTGQCQSMPLYYLILAEEIGAEAYWSFSPRHSFIKIQDERGKWHNLELTCKAILSDAHYMNSSYIKAEALQNKIYLEPLDKTNTIAEMLLELARGYYNKYGYDDFYLKCIDTAQLYLKNDLNAKLLKSAYQTQLTLTLANLLNAPKPEILNELSPEAYKHFELMLAQYKEIDDMGYEELPTSVYALWLDHIAKEKAKADKAKMSSKFLNTTKE